MKRLLLCAALIGPIVAAREVVFGLKDFELPGTLTTPDGRPPFPGLVLVHGSGPNDRDETIGPNKPFRDVADGLTARGIAVLRYDKRTKVHGGRGLQTMDDEIVTDACEAVRFLRVQPEIDPRRVYVLGHSQGGYAVPRIVERCPEIGGAVIAAGPVTPILELAREQIAASSPFTNPEPLIAQLRRAAPESYWRDLEGYNPAKRAAALSVPLLVLQGERDANIPVREYRLWQVALEGRKDVSFRTYSGLNHLFMAGEGPPRLDEALKEGRVAAAVITDVAAFIAAPAVPQKTVRLGIIGTDTSHVPAFTKILNDEKSPDFIPGARVVAAFKGGSQDVESSRTRVDGFAREIESKYGVEIVPDIATLLSKWTRYSLRVWMAERILARRRR